jgi:two-component system, sensor histidine kinase and response regulator
MEGKHPFSQGQNLGVLDRAALLARVEGDVELLLEIVELFLTDSSHQLAQIRDSAARRDAKALEKAAHGLKGALGNFSVQAAYDAALRLEMIGRSGDLNKAGEALISLEEEIERLRSALEALTKECRV